MNPKFNTERSLSGEESAEERRTEEPGKAVTLARGFKVPGQRKAVKAASILRFIDSTITQERRKHIKKEQSDALKDALKDEPEMKKEAEEEARELMEEKRKEEHIDALPEIETHEREVTDNRDEVGNDDPMPAGEPTVTLQESSDIAEEQQNTVARDAQGVEECLQIMSSYFDKMSDSNMPVFEVELEWLDANTEVCNYLNLLKESYKAIQTIKRGMSRSSVPVLPFTNVTEDENHVDILPSDGTEPSNRQGYYSSGTNSNTDTSVGLSRKGP